MIYVYVICKHGHCGEKYAIPVADDARFAECPTCHQNNSIDPSKAMKITGFCGQCSQPLDDHSDWTEDGRRRICPTKKGTWK